MNEERLQILRMVQEGKLSPEEASRLLEAVEPPGARDGGAKAKHVRVVLTQNGKTRSFTVGIGLAKTFLGIPRFILGIRAGEAYMDQEQLAQAVAGAKPGKIFEGQDDKERIEIWLDA